MNKVLLNGRITKDLELRKTLAGTSVIKFNLAVNRRFKQQGQPDADFIRCQAWGKTAETMVQYLHKGSLIGIEGRITTGTYKDKDGKTIFTTDVNIEAFEFLESRYKENNQPTYDNSNYDSSVASDYQFDSGPLQIDNDDLPF